MRLTRAWPDAGVQVLTQGFAKAVHVTRAWVVTGGVDAGVMSMLGSGLRKSGLAAASNAPSARRQDRAPCARLPALEAQLAATDPTGPVQQLAAWWLAVASRALLSPPWRRDGDEEAALLVPHRLQASGRRA